MEELNEIIRTNEQYRILYNIILDSTRLNYKNDSLTIDNDNTILQLIKYINPKKYEKRFEELQEKLSEYKKEKIKE